MFQVAGKLDKWSEVTEEKRCLAFLRLRMGEVLFNQAAVAIGEKDFKTAIRMLEDVCQFGVEEVKALMEIVFLGISWEDMDENDEDKAFFGFFFGDLKVLEDNSRQFRQLADALQLMANGDSDLAYALATYETLKLDLIFAVEDKYKSANLLSRGVDEEIVCMTDTKVAKLYLKVYTDGIHRTKAREILNDVMRFSDVINRNHYEADWYKEAATMLRELQEQEQSKEDSEWQNRRKAALAQLTEELKQLAEFSEKNDRGLVEALFQTFPPRHRPDESWRKLLPGDKEDGEIGWKNLFRKLVVIYHPDRVDKAKLGEKYHVLCEEITSELNRRYSKYK